MGKGQLPIMLDSEQDIFLRFLSLFAVVKLSIQQHKYIINKKTM